MKIYKLTWGVIGLSSKVRYFKNEQDIDALISNLEAAAAVMEIQKGQFYLIKEEVSVD
jgi:hypothetical protein